MSQTLEPPTTDPTNPLRKFGFWAVLSGAVALVLVFVQIVGPSLEPQPSAAS